jgi:hypothetical protein
MKNLILLFLFSSIFINVANSQTASENYNNSKNDTLIQKFEIMMWKVGQQVMSDSSTTYGGKYPQAALNKRRILAQKTFNDSDEYKRRFAAAVFSLGLFDENITDVNIESYIGIVYNSLANVTYEDLNP